MQVDLLSYLLGLSSTMGAVVLGGIIGGLLLRRNHRKQSRENELELPRRRSP